MFLARVWGSRPILLASVLLSVAGATLPQDQNCDREWGVVIFPSPLAGWERPGDTPGNLCLDLR